MKIQLNVVFFGDVQGVGFRATVRKHAADLDISGWVKNLDDGTVEALFFGEQSKIDDVLIRIQKEPGFARIASYETKLLKKINFFSTFEIL